MNKSRVYEIKSLGQSIWYDNIERSILTEGILKRMIKEDGISGVTSNPTIFEKAITESTEYDKEIAEMIKQGKTAEEIYSSLTIKDVSLAAEILSDVYKETKGAEGYVSIEVPPRFAYDKENTVEEAEKLFKTIGKHNIMIKVPATKEGVLAIEELTSRGVNVNATLIFSCKHYQATAWAYIRGLEKLLLKGRNIAEVASVASVFVSRIDTLVDKQITALMEKETDLARKKKLAQLLGKTAVANCKIIYQEFKRIFSSNEFKKLAEKGARVQRPLWASTSTKNPAYSDVKYVEELIGAETINTVPQVTLDAFRDHGRVSPSLEEGLREAEEVLSQIEKEGINLDEVCETLQKEGVVAFQRSFDNLIQKLKKK